MEILKSKKLIIEENLSTSTIYYSEKWIGYLTTDEYKQMISLALKAYDRARAKDEIHPKFYLITDLSVMDIVRAVDIRYLIDNVFPIYLELKLKVHFFIKPSSIISTKIIHDYVQHCRSKGIYSEVFNSEMEAISRIVELDQK
ncbi:MAG: hypothetical protein LAT68_13665 [Cyclobacteriaceae bacterium]|nr:hypothetical protein [Cyclobacteriaceae bacterium]MCH8517367.1 hypothetical protein [Cyclobacteriaceae bacterium]